MKKKFENDSKGVAKKQREGQRYDQIAVPSVLVLSGEEGRATTQVPSTQKYRPGVSVKIADTSQFARSTFPSQQDRYKKDRVRKRRRVYCAQKQRGKKK